VTGTGEKRLDDLLEELGAPTPAPGGGSSAAIACALAAALVEMAAGITAGREGESEPARVAQRARSVRAVALDLADRELTSFAPVLEAMRLPREDPSRAEAISSALLAASETPASIAELAADVAELAGEAAEVAGPSVRGDALTGGLLAESAAAAAASLVEINLAERGGDALNRARAARERARAAREAVLRGG
jgi:formiminotetrahydrofolate cyclodeaminase